MLFRALKYTTYLLLLYCCLLFIYPLLHTITLKFYRPTHSSFIRNYELNCSKKPCAVSQRWVDLTKINKKLISAVIASEDARFFNHDGIDYTELQKAFEINKRKGRMVRGASTITQQLAKNLYLTKKKSYLRKAREFIYAKWMETILSKKEILQLYLNLIEWGDGIYGIEAASHYYFKVAALDLTMDQAAWLAGIIPNPIAYSGRQRGIGNYRKNVILQRLGAINLAPLK